MFLTPTALVVSDFLNCWHWSCPTRKTSMKVAKILKKSRTQRVLLLVLGCMSSACLGYALRVLQHHIWCSASGDERPNAAALECELSFSEVENVRVTLASLADQYMADAYLEPRIRLQRSRSTDGACQAERATRVLPGYIERLESGLVEFQGTDQELRMTEKLLAVLKEAKIYDRWLDIYLDALYRHPTEPVIGRRAGDAVRIGNSLGQQMAVRRAFSLVRSIPLEFEARTQVEKAARELAPESCSTEPAAFD